MTATERNSIPQESIQIKSNQHITYQVRYVYHTHSHTRCDAIIVCERYCHMNITVLSTCTVCVPVPVYTLLYTL